MSTRPDQLFPCLLKDIGYCGRWLACAAAFVMLSGVGCSREAEPQSQSVTHSPAIPRIRRTFKPPELATETDQPELALSSLQLTSQSQPGPAGAANNPAVTKRGLSPEPLVPGATPLLSLVVRHGSGTQQIRVHLEANSQTQTLTSNLDPAATPGAGTVDTEMAVQFPALPAATLIRYWVEVQDGPGRTARLPATNNFAFYVQELPTGCKLPFYELSIAPKDLAKMEQSAFSNQTIPATFICNGEVYDHVKVRYRGAWSRSWPKKPIKIFFNKEQPFEGQHALNLNSGWHDPALAREYLAYRIFADCGVPCPKSRMVRLHLNGKFRGLYVQVQQPDKAFVKSFNLQGASVYKATSRFNQADERDLGSEESFRRHYEKQTRKEEGYAELQQFCHELAHTSDALAFFNQNLDVEKYINYLVASALVQNWDGFNKNHYLVYDGQGSKKWFVVPWDLDRTFGDHWNWSYTATTLPAVLGIHQAPGVTGWNRLEDRFLAQPTLRARFLDRLSDALQTQFTPERLSPMLDQIEAEIGPEAALDRSIWGNAVQSADLHGAISQLKQFVERRRAYLLSEIPKLRRGEMAAFSPR